MSPFSRVSGKMWGFRKAIVRKVIWKCFNQDFVDMLITVIFGLIEDEP